MTYVVRTFDALIRNNLHAFVQQLTPIPCDVLRFKQFCIIVLFD